MGLEGDKHLAIVKNSRTFYMLQSGVFSNILMSSPIFNQYYDHFQSDPSCERGLYLRICVNLTMLVGQANVTSNQPLI